MPAHGQGRGGSPLIVVRISVLPEIFPRVLEAKRLLACGEEKSSAAACKRVGISRSAFYKYRDSVFSYEEKLVQRVFSFYAVLQDEPGVLSAVLSRLHTMGANLLTVNQNIPIDGAASVTLSIRLGRNESPERVRAALHAMDGVVEIKIVSGE